VIERERENTYRNTYVRIERDSFELQASHGGRSRVRFRNEAILAGLGRVGPEPTVHRLISQIRVYPVSPFHRQIVWRLRLIIVKHHQLSTGSLVPEIPNALLLQGFTTCRVSSAFTCRRNKNVNARFDDSRNYLFNRLPKVRKLKVMKFTLKRRVLEMKVNKVAND